MIMRRLFIISLAVGYLSGCAHVISKEVLRDVDREIAFAQLRKAPKAYQGKVVLLGGVIVKTSNKQEGTLLEVYQTTIDNEGRPIKLDKSEGRFLALYKGVLDSEIYRNGRKITIAGIVQGEQTMRLGELDYHYPYLITREIYLWKEEQLRPYEPYPWGVWDSWWWHPSYPWYPWFHWYDPYWHPRVYRQ